MLFNGFLGSGKTTTMIQTAKYLRDRGIKVSLITNDLGENLVDTGFAQMEGASATEIPNGCLCHDVPNFLDVINQVVEKDNPDYIFAEPVGSCVGLVESVYKDLAKEHPDNFDLLPFIVLVDPFRYRSIYMSPEDNTFNEESTYMYRKQLDEADVILLNKCDLLSEEERDAILASLKEHFGDRVIIPISSKEASNYDTWTDAFLGGKTAGLRDNEIDWNCLMAGNEHLGWYNSTITLGAETPTDFNLVLDSLTDGIRLRLANAGQEIAHLKILAKAGGAFAKSASVGTWRDVVYSERLEGKQAEAVFNVNIRAQATPEELAEAVGAAVESTALLFGLKVNDGEEQTFDNFSAPPSPRRSRSPDPLETRRREQLRRYPAHRPRGYRRSCNGMCGRILGVAVPSKKGLPSSPCVPP